MLEPNIDLKNKTVLITGVAGFIGSNLAMRLLNTIENIKIIGIDNLNSTTSNGIIVSRSKLLSISLSSNIAVIRTLYALWVPTFLT